MSLKRREFVGGSVAFATSNFLKKPATAAPKNALHVPPEEALHDRTFMQWPVNREVYPELAFLDILQRTIAEIANTISEFEPVIMLADKADHANARMHLSSAVSLWDVPTEDLWCRDSGPLFAVQSDGTLAVSNLQFNGWGNKQIHNRDGKVAALVANRLGIPIIESGLKGEAGGVEQDGHGLLMAHESSWVNKNRNPDLSRDEIEQALLKAYGAQRMIWSEGVSGEDITDYHIDSLARFTEPKRVLINLPNFSDVQDPFHMAALNTYDDLTAAGLDVEIIPEPNHPRLDSVDFVASYANYYVCNGGVIAAQFGDDETDEMAAEALKQHYPNREIVTLNVDALGEVGGGIHCATQQMPAV